MKKFGLTVAGLAMAATSAFANPDSLVLTPPLGWNSWNVFHENINENQIKEIADAMVSSGLKDAGYVYLNLDDNWMHTKRDANGDLQHHPKTFPSGMKALADYVHAKGLKFGLYGDRGLRTCHHYNSKWESENGSYMHEEQDAKKFAEWGVDYLKYDNCDPAPGSNQEADYTRMSKALRNSGRDIVFSICAWGYQKWMPKIAHLWRSTFDIGPEWRSTSWYRGVYDIIDENNKYWEIAKPGNWNDPDMLEVDNRNLTYEEQKSQMTMWSIMAAPIMISSDVRKMSDQVKDLYINKDMLAINQDSLGVQGHRISNVNGKQVWTKPLRNGDIAVALLNDNTSTQTIEVNFKDIGVEGEVEVRDVWQKKDLGARSSVSAEIPAHGSVYLRLIVKPIPREPFKGEALAIPGKIEIEDFDIPGVGTANVTYYDTDDANNGTSDYRKGTGVDLKEENGKVVLGWGNTDEWLEYTVNVKKAGEYTMYAAVATGSADGAGFKLSLDGKDITDTITVKPNEQTGDEENFDDYSKVHADVTLPAGEHILRFTITKAWLDVDFINFVNAGESDPEPIPGQEDDPSAIALTSPTATVNLQALEAAGKVQYFDMQGHRLNAAAAKNPGVYMARFKGVGNRIVRVEK